MERWFLAGLIAIFSMLAGGPEGERNSPALPVVLAQSQPGDESKPVDPVAKKKNQRIFRDDLYPALSHARCANCHGRVNMVTGANHAAGPAAQFSNCATSGCHTPKEGFPAADWQAAPASMWFDGKDPVATCLGVKKHINAQQFVDLLKSDELIHWTFNPGKGRVPVPGGYERYLRKAEEWVQGGGFCPE